MLNNVRVTENWSRIKFFMTMTRAIWWSDGDENLNRVSRREGAGEGIETMCTDNYVKISCERSKRRGTARASMG